MSNTISFIRGTSKEFEIDLVDENGNPINRGGQGLECAPDATLEGATAVFILRVLPTDVVDVLKFTTVLNPTSLSIDQLKAILLLTFTPLDTSALALGLYNYQIQVTLESGDVFDVIPWSLFDLNLGGTAMPVQPPFLNTVKISHDYPLAGDMTYMTPGGSPIVNAQIRVYYKSDYDAGNLGAPVGITSTDDAGKWRNSLLVLPGFTYVSRFEVPGCFGPDVKEFFA
jgi:hypothetical protein